MREPKNVFAEPLEPRLLFSSHFHVAKGLITLIGTPRTDKIEVSIFSDITQPVVAILFLNGHRYSAIYHESGRGILIRGLAGDDDILCHTNTLDPLVRFTISGGNGNDIITLPGPNHAAHITGGNGNDILTAQPGDGDTLIGGDGDDLVQTYTPTLDPHDPRYTPRITTPDEIVSLNRSSILHGDAGNDTLLGSIFNDLLSPGPGQDTLRTSAENSAT